MMLAGGGPAATHFSCFAKKSKQKKATAQPLPFGFPFVQYKKWETGETRLRLRQRPFLFPFSVLHKRQRHSGWQVNNHDNFKSNDSVEF
jgi:hypothetical protein